MTAARRAPERPFNGRFPVRGFGSGAIHLAYLLDAHVQAITFLGADCFGNDLLPVVAVCTTIVGRGRGWVVMEPAAKPTCTACKRLAVRRP